MFQTPADAIIADWEYPTAEPSDVHPDDSVSQAGRKPTAQHHDLDVEDYRRDNGIRMSSRRHHIRRNSHRSAQQDRRYLEMQQRRVVLEIRPSPPPLIASRATSDLGPTLTPAPSPPSPPPNRLGGHRRDSAKQMHRTPCAAGRPETAG